VPGPISVMQTSFTGGEWAPSLYARTRLNKYFTAVRRMRNFIIQPHGPASNRPGTRFINVTKFRNRLERLIPFEFSVIQTYVLEFGNFYMRVFRDGAPVTLPGKTITGATQTDPVNISSTAHGFSDGDHIIISGIDGMDELNGRTFEVNNPIANSFELIDPQLGTSIDGTGFSAYVSGGLASEIFELVTPYPQLDLKLLKYEQSADVMYLTHPSHAERKLTRTDHDAWTLVPTVYGAGIAAPTTFARTGGPVGSRIFAVTAAFNEGTESVISNTDTGKEGSVFTWDIVSNADYYNFYEQVNGIFGWLGFAGLGLSFTVPEALEPDFATAPPKLGDFFTGAGNFPGSTAFFEQRLLRARTNNEPQTVRGSVTADFDNFNTSVPLKDDDAYAFTINSNQVNEIRWLVALRTLVIGTSGSIWQMSSGTGRAITFNDVNVVKQASIGVSDLFPIVIENSVIFVEFSGSKVRDLFFSFDEDIYKGNDVSILATHLFENNTVVDWSYQRHPNSIIWGVMSDGTLAGLTYYREHEVIGWHTHDTQGNFEATTNISTAAGIDEVYFIVQRIINGKVRKFVERLEERLPNEDLQDSFFVDSGLSLDVPIAITSITQADPAVVGTGPAHGFSNGDLVDIDGVEGMTEVNDLRFKVANVTAFTFSLQDQLGADIDSTLFGTYLSNGKVRKTVTVILGLSHLEGEKVTILSNGNVVRGRTVTNAQITLPSPASRVHIGLGYISDLETMEFEFPTETGNTVQDKRRDVDSVVLRLENTRALSVGPSVDKLREIAFRDGEDYDTPARLFTGDKVEILDAGQEREGRVFMRNVDPLPVTITAITARLAYGES